MNLVLTKDNILKLLEILSMYISISKLFGGIVKSLLKVWYEKEGFLNFLVFNGDLKMNIKIEVASGYEGMSKYYNVNMIYKIFNGLKEYDFIEFDFEKDLIKYNDGEIKLIGYDENIEKFNLVKEVFVVNSNIDAMKYKMLDVNDEILNNINELLDIFKLKNSKCRNMYYYDEGCYYFDFFDLYGFMYVKDVLSVKVDLYSLKLINKILNLYNYKQFVLFEEGERVYFNNGDIYLEFNSMDLGFKDDDIRLKLLKNISKYNSENMFIINSRIFNFIKIVDRSDIMVSVYYDSDSKKFLVENEYINMNFNSIDVKGDVKDFVVKLESLKRVMNYIKRKDIDEYIFYYIESNGERFLKYSMKNIDIYINLL